MFVTPTSLAISPVVISVADIVKLYPDFNPKSFVVVTSGATTLDDDAKATQFTTVPSQADDLTGSGTPTEIAFEANWPKHDRRVVTIEYGDEADIAPLRSTDPSGAHALFAKKYEGMGWESNWFAWRLYFDARNAIDLYGKRQPTLSLDYYAKPKVNYEAESPYGRDIFWVGQALGVGAVGALVNGQAQRVATVANRSEKIIADGPVRAIVEISYTGWTVGTRTANLTSRITVWAGAHWFQHNVTMTGGDGITLVAGLPVKPKTTVISSTDLAGDQHRFVATWGDQVQPPHETVDTNGDNLGLAVIMAHGAANPADAQVDPLNNYMAVSMRKDGDVSTGRWAVLCAWDQQAPDTTPASTTDPGALLPDCVKSADGWKRYIHAVSPAIFMTARVDIPGHPGALVIPDEAPLTQAVADPGNVPPPGPPPPPLPAADLDPRSKAAVVDVMRKAADYQLGVDALRRDYGWERGTLYAGVLATYATTKDEKYKKAALDWANAANWTPTVLRPRAPKKPAATANPIVPGATGNPIPAANPIVPGVAENPTAKLVRLGNADNQCCVQTFAELAIMLGDKTKLAPVTASFDAEVANPVPGRTMWWWVDSLFMAPAAFALVSDATGDPKYAAFMKSLWWDTTDFLYDKGEHLYFRDKSYFNKLTPTGKKVFWARGNGWVMAGNVRVLEYLPADDPDRAKFVKIHQEMAAKIITLQGSDGLWRTSLLDPDQFPDPETSGTGFFCYALAWGINHGTLDRATYLPSVLKAWHGLVTHVQGDGKLCYAQSEAGGPGRPGRYLAKDYATGALLLAGSEVEKLADRP
jgi:rhamnogalacturonyl hydrolase YesR